MALLHVLSSLRGSFALELHAHGVDHGLRVEADAELSLAEQLARALEVPFSRSSLRVSPGGNLQARARDARYRALETVARDLGGALIATAHHADDRAETVLLRLLRGAGPDGLAVLPARDAARLRPLIRARRRDVLSHLLRHGIAFAEDPSNRDARFLRVRVRHEVLPLLEELSPGIVDHLTALADELLRTPRRRLEDHDGNVLLLGRAQRTLLDTLVSRRSASGRVRLRGGRELRVDPATGAVRIDPEESGHRRTKTAAAAVRLASAPRPKSE
jgi:tRNA(Ile)-lysidine synthase